MEKGDISNGFTPRWFFTLDALTDGQPLPKKRFWNTWEDIANQTPIPQLSVGVLWAFFNRTTVVIEVVCFGMNDEYCKALQDRLEREGLNPVKYVTPFVDRKALLDHLAFRGDVQAVVDLPENVNYWGRRGVSVESVTRIG